MNTTRVNEGREVRMYDGRRRTEDYVAGVILNCPTHRGFQAVIKVEAEKASRRGTRQMGNRGLKECGTDTGQTGYRVAQLRGAGWVTHGRLGRLGTRSTGNWN